jgi:hypothetical protein
LTARRRISSRPLTNSMQPCGIWLLFVEQPFAGQQQRQ